MHICDKINMDKEGLIENGHINIVLFGDSITHGAVGYDIDYEAVYWNLLRKKLNSFRDYVPVNMINAGIGGLTATASLPRLQRDVLCHHPDLIVVCFGLNDAVFELQDYISSLQTIFRQCRSSGADVIFMTPNMFNTYVAEDTLPELQKDAAMTAEIQNSGKMDRFMEAARTTAREFGIPVCDCYAVWKQMYADGRDITMLLGNRINHPNAEMHHIFADMLYNMIMDTNPSAADNASTMLDKF